MEQSKVCLSGILFPTIANTECLEREVKTLTSLQIQMLESMSALQAKV